jgi:chromosome segregation ATPase
LKQAVVEAVRAEKQNLDLPIDLKQVEEALLKEKEERKSLKSHLKAERKQNENLVEKIKQLEKEAIEMGSSSNRLDIRKLERELSNRAREIEVLQTEISELRNEKIISEQLDEEHSAKMKVYTQDLMATSVKYQQDIQSLIGKNEKLVKEVEVLKAKIAELERQGGHSDQVNEVLNKKIHAKDQEIGSLQGQVEKLMKDRKVLQDQIDRTPRAGVSTSAGNAEILQTRIRELEAVISSQRVQIADFESRNKTQYNPSRNDDAFGILRSSKSLTPARRVSHLTSRREAQSYAPVAPDYSEWLEPLAIAEHVLNGAATAAVK